MDTTLWWKCKVLNKKGVTVLALRRHVRQSKTWKSCSIFFFWNEWVPSEFLPRAYWNILWNDVRTKRAVKWVKGFLFQHENAPWHMSLLSPVFGRRKDSCMTTSTLLSGFGTVRPLSGPKNKNRVKRKTSWHHSRHWDVHDSATEVASKRSL